MDISRASFSLNPLHCLKYQSNHLLQTLFLQILSNFEDLVPKIEMEDNHKIIRTGQPPKTIYQLPLYTFLLQIFKEPCRVVSL